MHKVTSKKIINPSKAAKAEGKKRVKVCESVENSVDIKKTIFIITQVKLNKSQKQIVFEKVTGGYCTNKEKRLKFIKS